MAHTPVRMCVICRQRFAQTALTRHVRTPDGALTPDPRRRMPGRGWYVCAAPACGERFQKYAKGMMKRKGRAKTTAVDSQGPTA